MDYALSHETVHGSDTAWLFARRRVSSDTVALFAKTADPIVLAAITPFGASSLVESTRADAAIFGWMIPGKFDDLAKGVQQAAESYSG